VISDQRSAFLVRGDDTSFVNAFSGANQKADR
jgi:hypothetical protein